MGWINSQLGACPFPATVKVLMHCREGYSVRLRTCMCYNVNSYLYILGNELIALTSRHQQTPAHVHGRTHAHTIFNHTCTYTCNHSNLDGRPLMSMLSFLKEQAQLGDMPTLSFSLLLINTRDSDSVGWHHAGFTESLLRQTKVTVPVRVVLKLSPFLCIYARMYTCM